MIGRSIHLEEEIVSTPTEREIAREDAGLYCDAIEVSCRYVPIDDRILSITGSEQIGVVPFSTD